MTGLPVRVIASSVSLSGAYACMVKKIIGPVNLDAGTLVLER
jgi:hypothetical protein